VRVGRGVPAVALNLGKNATAALGFLVLLLATTGVPWPSMDAEPLLLLALSGVVGLTVCDTLLFRAYLEVGPRRANLFMASTPVLVALVALLPPLSESPPPLAWAGMAVCLAGIVTAILEQSLDPIRRTQLRRGARDGLLAALFQALGLLLARQALTTTGVSVAEGAMVRLVAGTAGLVLLGLVTGRFAGWGRALARDGAWRRVVGAALIGTFLGILANQAALAWASHVGVQTTLNSLAPVFLIPLSAVFLGEAHDRRAWVSSLLALLGIALLALSAE
jgi:drug/metabolite transporter (DMT)-like permease